MFADLNLSFDALILICPLQFPFPWCSRRKNADLRSNISNGIFYRSSQKSGHHFWHHKWPNLKSWKLKYLHWQNYSKRSISNHKIIIIMTINCVVKNPLANPGRDFRQDWSSVEEIENHDRHDHRHRRHCHHKGQVDSWENNLSSANNGKDCALLKEFSAIFQFSMWRRGPSRANFCASAAQKFPHSQTYAETTIWKLFVCLFVCFFVCARQTDQRDGLAGLRHPLSDGQHEHRESEDHLADIIYIYLAHIICLQILITWEI